MVCESCSKQHAAKLRDATQCAREAHAIFPRVMRRNHTTPFTTLLAREAAQLHLSRAARSALPNTRCHVQGDALKFRYLLSLPLSWTPRPLSYLNWRWGSAAPCRDGSKLRSGSQLPEHPSLGHRGFKPQGHLGGESAQVWAPDSKPGDRSTSENGAAGPRLSEANLGRIASPGPAAQNEAGWLVPHPALFG